MTIVFGNFIRQKRKKLGLPLKRVASELNISTSALSKIETEERNISLDLIPKLATVLRTTDGELANHYYASKVVQELDGYQHYNDVFNLVDFHLNSKSIKRISSTTKSDEYRQSSLSFQDSWVDKEFKNPNAKVRIGTIFSGIGAIEYAFKRLNLNSEIVFASDIDKFVKQSYFANYDLDESHWYEDVHDLDGSKYCGEVDLLVGGSPCQSFSMVGKRRGLEDTRGTLF